jgi:hypothetical protein
VSSDLAGQNGYSLHLTNKNSEAHKIHNTYFFYSTYNAASFSGFQFEKYRDTSKKENVNYDP